MTTEQESFDSKQFLKTASKLPGIYKMLDESGQIIYVGKAKNLKNRLSSYFQNKHHTVKTSALVSKIAAIETIITQTEHEALLLENTLIKEHRPKYNVLFRDDKTYPYIYFSDQDAFPSLRYYRGRKRPAGQYFGPYSHANAVREILNFLQKCFQIRTCEPAVFNHRSRPCLQYQIKRCSAPCVSYISESDYKRDVNQAVQVLRGQREEVAEQLTNAMNKAADEQAYEVAAQYRDRISQLRHLQASQSVIGQSSHDEDVVVAVSQNQTVCIQILKFQQGALMRSDNLLFDNPVDEPLGYLLGRYISQAYLYGRSSDKLPKTILVNQIVDDSTLLSELLSESANTKVSIQKPIRGQKREWITLAEMNAEQVFKQQAAEQSYHQQQLEQLQSALELDRLPSRMECFDVSHTQGVSTQASCVVFEAGKPKTSDYRRFNVHPEQKNDDYAAIKEAVWRRYKRVIEQESADSLPDLVIVDGGKGQLKQAIEVFKELQIQAVYLISIAKGPDRKAGQEQIFAYENDTIVEKVLTQSELILLQYIRDESHRFAISGHRRQRSKNSLGSGLEQIPGIGAVKRRALLQYFGGLSGVKSASVNDLQKVNGISKPLAQKIYDAFHG